MKDKMPSGFLKSGKKYASGLRLAVWVGLSVTAACSGFFAAGLISHSDVMAAVAGAGCAISAGVATSCGVALGKLEDASKASEDHENLSDCDGKNGQNYENQ